MKLWQRYLLGKISGTFCFILGSIFLVYALVDLSIHGVDWISRGSALALFFHYIRSFAMHLELFVPLAFLLTILKVLLNLNSHFELLALQMGTLSVQKILAPFFAAAFVLSCVCYANNEWFAPNAFFSANSFPLKKKRDNIRLHALALEDQSDLVYQRFDPEKKELSDVFWIRSVNDVWHMKTLSLTSWPPEGHQVDHFIRSRMFEKVESFDACLLEDLPLKTETPLKVFVPFEHRSLTSLGKQAFTQQTKGPMIQSHFYFKLLTPLLPFLILFTIAPFTIPFSRQRRNLLLIALSLFSLITFTTLLESLLILGENQVLPPLLGLWSPVALVFVLALPRFRKL